MECPILDPHRPRARSHREDRESRRPLSALRAVDGLSRRGKSDNHNLTSGVAAPRADGATLGASARAPTLSSRRRPRHGVVSGPRGTCRSDVWGGHPGRLPAGSPTAGLYAALCARVELMAFKSGAVGTVLRLAIGDRPHGDVERRAWTPYGDRSAVFQVELRVLRGHPLAHCGRSIRSVQRGLRPRLAGSPCRPRAGC